MVRELRPRGKYLHTHTHMHMHMHTHTHRQTDSQHLEMFCYVVCVSFGVFNVSVWSLLST